MLDKKDLEMIGELMDKRLDVCLGDLERNLRDEIRSTVSASEHRMMNKLDEVRYEFAELLSDNVLPQVEELQRAVFPQRFAR